VRKELAAGKKGGQLLFFSSKKRFPAGDISAILAPSAIFELSLPWSSLFFCPPASAPTVADEKCLKKN
jgi:hypothetical protein